MGVTCEHGPRGSPSPLGPAVQASGSLERGCGTWERKGGGWDGTRAQAAVTHAGVCGGAARRPGAPRAVLGCRVLSGGTTTCSAAGEARATLPAGACWEEGPRSWAGGQRGWNLDRGEGRPAGPRTPCRTRRGSRDVGPAPGDSRARPQEQRCGPGGRCWAWPLGGASAGGPAVPRGGPQALPLSKFSARAQPWGGRAPHHAHRWPGGPPASGPAAQSRNGVWGARAPGVAARSAGAGG